MNMQSTLSHFAFLGLCVFLVVLFVFSTEKYADLEFRGLLMWMRSTKYNADWCDVFFFVFSFSIFCLFLAFVFFCLSFYVFSGFLWIWACCVLTLLGWPNPHPAILFLLKNSPACWRFNHPCLLLLINLRLKNFPLHRNCRSLTAPHHPRRNSKTHVDPRSPDSRTCDNQSGHLLAGAQLWWDQSSAPRCGKKDLTFARGPRLIH